MVCSKNCFRILAKNVKAKCRKESTWEEGRRVEWWGSFVRGKFFVLTTFIINSTFCLIFIRVWPIEDFLFEIRQLDKLRKYMINMISHVILTFYLASKILSTAMISHVILTLYLESKSWAQHWISYASLNSASHPD